MQGFSFVEVLIALVIISIAMLGIAQMEITALRNTQEAYWQSIANTQVASIFERFRANPLAKMTECDNWNQENKFLLPEGQGSCSCSTSLCTITLQWRNHQLTLQASI